jgi:hypothetical protein
MALVVLPEGQQRSGSIGGTVWSRNRFGAYIRNRSVPVNPNTDRQVVVRNIVRALTIAWQNTLTTNQRDAWDTYAANVTWLNKLGQSVNLTGLNHYIRSNTPRLQSGSARVDPAPLVFNLATAELELGVTASEATQQASVVFDDTAAWANETGGHQYVYGGLPQNGGIKFFGGPWRLIGVIDGDDITPPATPDVADYPFPFGEGQRLWVRTRVSRLDGRLSEFAQVNFLADA